MPRAKAKTKGKGGKAIAPRPKGRQIAPTSFTPKRQAEFLSLITVGWAVLHAATRVGIIKQTAYELRNRDPAFAEAWAAAKEDGQHRLEEEANRRAMGWIEVHTDKSGEEYESYKCSDTLMIFLLKSMDPRKYRDQLDVTLNEKRHIILDLMLVEKDENTGRLMLVDEMQPPLLTSGGGEE